MRTAPMANREDEEDDGEAEGGENALRERAEALLVRGQERGGEGGQSRAQGYDEPPVFHVEHR